jgi:hypothetical protein
VGSNPTLSAFFMSLYEIYIERFSEELVPLEDFLLDIKNGRYGNFGVGEIRAFRFQLESNIQESAYIKGGELGIGEKEIERIIEEKIEEIRKLFLEVFGWL